MDTGYGLSEFHYCRLHVNHNDDADTRVDAAPSASIAQRLIDLDRGVRGYRLQGIPLDS